MLESLFNNPIFGNSWFISIVCNLLSGIISYIGTKVHRFINRKHTIDDANRFVLNQLRVFMISGNPPDLKIITAVQHSAARKFNIKSDKLLAPSACLEEIATELVGTAHLQIGSRADYLEMIHKCTENEDADALPETSEDPSKNIREDTSLVSISATEKDTRSNAPNSEQDHAWTSVRLAIIATAPLLLIMQLFLISDVHNPLAVCIISSLFGAAIPLLLAFWDRYK